ncbi:MAG: prolyl oligopeptidase family serine peptidase [Burkholderiales bacterium]|nr:prolyl oligopeptidase family serine peptidase [Burkholderiales bacterium]
MPKESSRPGPNMTLRRRRDSQQWIHDWMVKQTGRDRQYFYDGRTLPASVKSYAMIPREMEKEARHRETLARAAEAAGHLLTACELYHKAVESYHGALHPLPYDGNRESEYLYGRLAACFRKVVELNPAPMEWVEIPFEGGSLPGIFYRARGDAPAPTVMFSNGMDVPMELFPDPLDNPFVARGMNVLALDGPGQGLALQRGIWITADNWQRAGAAAIDFLARRPEVDMTRLGGVGWSMGTYWIMSLAARDRRLKALAAGSACYGAKRGIFEMCSPHFKKRFMHMANIEDEAEFDEMVEGMALTDDELARIEAISLLVVGEYDPMTPLEEAVDIFEALKGPREFWLMENDGHGSGPSSHLGGYHRLHAVADWMLDALAGRKDARLDRKVVIHPNRGRGVYAAGAPGFFLPERLEAE